MKDIVIIEYLVETEMPSGMMFTVSSRDEVLQMAKRNNFDRFYYTVTDFKYPLKSESEAHDYFHSTKIL